MENSAFEALIVPVILCTFGGCLAGAVYLELMKLGKRVSDHLARLFKVARRIAHNSRDRSRRAGRIHHSARGLAVRGS